MIMKDELPENNLSAVHKCISMLSSIKITSIISVSYKEYEKKILPSAPTQRVLRELTLIGAGEFKTD